MGAQILDWSRAQVALMRPAKSSRALAVIIRDIIDTRDGATYFAERVSGVGPRYDLSGTHPLVGRSIPDFELLDGSRVNEHLRAGYGLLLDFNVNASLGTLACCWADRSVYVAQNAKISLGLGAALVRPDGVVAWACGGVPALEDVEKAAIRWFGKATGTT